MILWADSFDHYGTDEANMLDGPWAEVGTGWAISNIHPRTGTYGMLKSGITTNDFRRVFGNPYSRVGVGQAIYFEELPGGNNRAIVCEFRDGANNCQVAICVESTGAIAVYKGTGGSTRCSATRLGLSTKLLKAGSQNHLECAALCDATAGTVEVRLNEVTILNLAGIDTDPQNSGEFSQWAAYGKSNFSGSTYVDDIIAWEGDGSSGDGATDFVGDKKVFTQFPDGDTADVDWTPSSGATRWQMVDDADPDDDTTYASASAPGELMGLTFPDLPASTVSVVAVIACYRSKKTDAGSCKLQASIKSSGDAQVGVERPQTVTYTTYDDVFEIDPHTGAPFTPTSANASTLLFDRTV